MKKKSLALLLALALLAALLTGCGKTETGAQQPQVSQTDLEPAPRTEEPEEPAETPAEPEEPAEQEEPAEPEEPAEEEAESRVEGNPGKLLRVGDEVFFRTYDTSVMTEPALWASFIDTWYEERLVAELWAYNTVTGELRSLGGCGSYGDLSLIGDSLYVTDWGSEDSVYYGLRRFALEGGAADVLENTALLLVDPEGVYSLRMEHENNDDEGTHAVYRNAEPYYTLDGSFDEFTPCGFGPEGELVILNAYYDEELYGYSVVIRQIFPDGSVTELGTLEADEFGGYPDVHGFLADPETGRFYLILNYYQGAAAPTDYRAVRGTLGEENSLQLVRKFSGDEGESAPEPGIYLTREGDFGLSRRVPGALFLSEEDAGDLYYVDREGDEILLTENFIDPEQGSGFVIQAGAVLGDAAYLIVADAQRSPSGDVGWRWAYDLLELYYLRVPLDTGRPETLTGPRWTGLSAAEPVEEIDYSEVAGSWRLGFVNENGDGVYSYYPNEEGTLSIDYWSGYADFAVGGYQQDFSQCEIQTYIDEEQIERTAYLFSDPSTEDTIFLYLTDPVSMILTFDHNENGENISSSTYNFYYEPTEGSPEIYDYETDYETGLQPYVGYWTVSGWEVEGYTLSEEELDFFSYVTIEEDGVVYYGTEEYSNVFMDYEALDGASYDGGPGYLFYSMEDNDRLYIYLQSPDELVATVEYNYPGGDVMSWTGFYRRAESENGAPVG